MAIQPQIAGYTGTLSGTPVLINPQADRGWVSEWIVVIPTGTGVGVRVTIGTDVIPVPLGLVVTIPGPAAQFTVNSATNGYIIYVGTGTTPMYAITQSGGGGGGGGAPTTAPYLLDSATVDPSLTSGVAIRALDHTLDVNYLASGAGGAASPMKLVASYATAPPTMFGGVALPLRWLSSAGEQTLAQIGASWIDVSNPAAPKAALTVALGASETLAMLIKVGEIDLPGDNIIKASGDLTLQAQNGAGSVTVGSTAPTFTLLQAPENLAVTSGLGIGDGLFLYGKFQVNLQADTGNVAISTNSMTGEVIIAAGEGGTPVELRLNATTATLTCDGVQIQNIADGTHPTDAAACGQFLQGIQRFTAGDNQKTIAVNAKFNGKACTASFNTIPGGAIDLSKPVAIVTDISAGILTLSIIDTKTGALLVGGIHTAVDVAYISIAV